jgi:hypothetical protein
MDYLIQLIWQAIRVLSHRFPTDSPSEPIWKLMLMAELESQFRPGPELDFRKRNSVQCTTFIQCLPSKSAVTPCPQNFGNRTIRFRPTSAEYPFTPYLYGKFRLTFLLCNTFHVTAEGCSPGNNFWIRQRISRALFHSIVLHIFKKF